MTRCAIQDVYELHQNSQAPAVHCEPMSDVRSKVTIILPSLFDWFDTCTKINCNDFDNGTSTPNKNEVMLYVFIGNFIACLMFLLPDILYL